MKITSGRIKSGILRAKTKTFKLNTTRAKDKIFPMVHLSPIHPRNTPNKTSPADRAELIARIKLLSSRICPLVKEK